MRFVVYGAGAIGGVVGGRLFEHGHDVALIARGAHYDAIRSKGLRVETPDGARTYDIDVADHPGGIDWRADDVVLLAMKTQDTPAALAALAECADVPVVCMQNGVENERLALRLFADVYAVPVMAPAVHLEPGVVEAYATPVCGILDVGRYPSGVDATAQAIAEALEASGFSSVARPDIMRWKYTKLLLNLGNAVEALFGEAARTTDLAARARAEGRTVLDAAGIDHATEAEERERRGDLLRLRPIGDRRRPGGSTWQSMARGAGTVETDYLNGEVVLLGRLHGVATPVNSALQRAMADAVRRRAEPGSVEPQAFEAALETA